MSQIATIIVGQAIALPEDVIVRELLTDTRRAVFPESSLFFALKGERRDGHTFLGEAWKKGIRNFIVSLQQQYDLPGSNIIVVKDVLAALQCLAAHHRSQFHIPVIGITGSNGKTVVKEWLNQLLDNDYNIVRSPKSYNSQIGVPLSVWQINESNTLGIFEAGISQSGEMEKLQKIIHPSIGIFTNTGDAHASGFLNIRQKINEKLRLFSNVNTLIYCRDYPE
ncbi:MAG: bifunctional UDP-N-acetylmuramoyl-tripeptide:D-alanyl-D-alanine ligase/alanine racemase, partial [Chitinophagaceae bacterium]|nr:bifunctional UDP-N-acetylmuramoyl-tripeptide:D-alanyl-D-alanine ligase/alanine racemase [Chitinophagaceae bacterium]